MGYSTEFKGKLNFTTDLTGKQLAKLETYLGEDCRDHSEWGVPHLSYIDLKLTKDYSGVEWDGSEKTYDLEEKINFIITEMKKEYSEFGFMGELLAQGEDIEDRYLIVIDEDGKAVKRDVIVQGTVIKCPNCNCKFQLEE